MPTADKSAGTVKLQMFPPGPQKLPYVTVDLIIELPDNKIVLIERKYEPLGFALPGGFVELGETVEETAMREAKEETDLDVELQGVFKVVSDPKRDPRFHTISIVFRAKAAGTPKAGDDAKEVHIFSLKDTLPDLCFDHGEVLGEFRELKMKK